MNITNGTINNGNGTCNCIIALPNNYDATKKYPLLIAGEGTGESSGSILDLYKNGLPTALKAGFTPPEDYVILCPQRGSYSVDPAWLPGILTDALKRWSINTNRIYLTGYSAGGWMCYGAVMNVNPTFGSNFAAILTLSGATQDAVMANIGWWKTNPVPVWMISGDQDTAFTGQSQDMLAKINGQVPGLAMLTIRPNTGHSGWTSIYNDTWGGASIWDWFAKNVKSGTNAPPVVVAPPPTIAVLSVTTVNGKTITIFVDGTVKTS